MVKIGNLLNGIYLGEMTLKNGLKEALENKKYEPGQIMKTSMNLAKSMTKNFDYNFMDKYLKEKDPKAVIARSVILGQYQNISDVIDYSYMNANWIDGDLETQVSCAVIGLLGHNALYATEIDQFFDKTEYKDYFYACKDQFFEDKKLGVAGASIFIYNNFINMSEALNFTRDLKDNKYLMPVVAGLINAQDNLDFEIKEIDDIKKEFRN